MNTETKAPAELPPGEREAEATAWVFPRRYGSGVTLSKSEWDFIRKQAGGMEDYEPGHYYPLFRVPPQIDELISNLRTKCIAQPTFATDPYWHGYLKRTGSSTGDLNRRAEMTLYWWWGVKGHRPDCLCDRCLRRHK